MLLNFVVPTTSDARAVPKKKRKKPKNRFQRRRQQKLDAKAARRYVVSNGGFDVLYCVPTGAGNKNNVSQSKFICAPQATKNKYCAEAAAKEEQS